MNKPTILNYYIPDFNILRIKKPKNAGSFTLFFFLGFIPEKLRGGKMLSELAINDPSSFKQLVEKAQAALNS